MKRKVNLVGNNTLTVSLPKKWTEKYNLKKGDEVEILEEGKNLLFTTSSKTQIKEITTNLSNFGCMKNRVIGSLYKSGYDKIKVVFENPEDRQIVENELTKGFISMDIIHQSNDYCILEAMANINPEELDNSIRRAFRLLIENANESLEAIKKKNYKELENVITKDININKFSDFSRRLLNKFGYSKPEKTSTIYYIVEDLEKIGDKYRDLCKYMVKYNVTLSKKMLAIYEKVNNYLSLFYELFYNFDEKKFDEFGIFYKDLNKEIESMYDSLKNKELIVLMRLQLITTSIFDLNGPLITSKF